MENPKNNTLWKGLVNHYTITMGILLISNIFPWKKELYCQAHIVPISFSSGGSKFFPSQNSLVVFAIYDIFM